MPLFQVEGWNLKTNNVSFDDPDSKRRKKKSKNNKEKSQKRNDDKSDLKQNPDEAITKIQPSTIDATSKSHAKVSVEVKKQKRKLEEADLESTLLEQPAKKALTPLQKKMMAKLSGSRFRWINEQLYTISSNDALDLIKKQPELFDEYHDGFRSQVQSWPENPVDIFCEEIVSRSKKPVNAPGGLPGLANKNIVISDMGCGEAQLALKVNKLFAQYNKRVKKYQKKNCIVHSFDLKKVNDRITVADIKNVPLPDESCTIVVFCLALMGTNFLDFIKEAYRLLAPRGELWIAEIKSRFADGKGEEFVNALKLMGFFHKKTDDTNKMFTRFEFFKPPQDIIEERKAKLERKQKFIEVETEKEELEQKRSKVPEGKWLLKPCIYKRR
ncbi:LAFE_0H10528g1_1 [Lachancea fermentati]|uniref:Ribosomal RNA-processing protein 8 n=1 Tax=Lachancea fermentati TaxID=4955 RepID=A0A1G4MKE5_LACFM|nr:LAFE_0H10528g1_1 [Lachancea fermentati]